MKKFALPLYVATLAASGALFYSCSSDPEPEPDNNTTFVSPGDTEGYVIYEGDSTVILGKNDPEDSPLYILANNQTPDSNNFVSGYPSVTIKLANGLPQSDTIIDISSSNYYVSLDDMVNNFSYDYSSLGISGQTMTADVSGEDLIITFENISVRRWTGSDYAYTTISGSVRMKKAY